MKITNLPRPRTIDDVPIWVVIPAFVLSELKTAFQIGFVIYIPFLVIDMVVSAVLMAMGMMMLPPIMISTVQVDVVCLGRWMASTGRFYGQKLCSHLGSSNDRSSSCFPDERSHANDDLACSTFVAGGFSSRSDHFYFPGCYANSEQTLAIIPKMAAIRSSPCCFPDAFSTTAYMNALSQIFLPSLASKDKSALSLQQARNWSGIKIFSNGRWWELSKKSKRHSRNYPFPSSGSWQDSIRQNIDHSSLTGHPRAEIGNGFQPCTRPPLVLISKWTNPIVHFWTPAAWVKSAMTSRRSTIILRGSHPNCNSKGHGPCIELLKMLWRSFAHRDPIGRCW